MAGATDGRSGMSVSSWGWRDFDGNPPGEEKPHFRVWSVRNRADDRIAMLLLPPGEYDAGDALMLAVRAFEPDEDA